MNPSKVVLDTDVIADFLTIRRPRQGAESASLMRRLLSVAFCYTTVFNAAELFARARTEREQNAVADALGCMKVLGLNARSAPALGAILRRKRDRGSGDLTLLIGALCRESRLPLVTYRSANFRKIQGLRVLPAQRLECVRGAEGLTSILAGRQR